jgi:LmbE family N-acetylglucosaminyl deacetylase
VSLLDELEAPGTMVVVAHPDDETVGASSLLPRLKHAHFVYVTDGAPRDGLDAARHGWSAMEYRDVRRRERASVFALCGIATTRIVDLDCPDQEAALRLGPLVRKLATLFDKFHVARVLTHPYEGGHPDHDATAFIVHTAARLAPHAPSIVEMTSYHNGPHGLVAGEFLPDATADARAASVPLSDGQRAFKQLLIDCHASQRETLRWLPVSIERFRPAPAYDFRRAPHEGRLWYETRGWDIDGKRFRQLAAAALDAVGAAA